MGGLRAALVAVLSLDDFATFREWYFIEIWRCGIVAGGLVGTIVARRLGRAVGNGGDVG